MRSKSAQTRLTALLFAWNFCAVTAVFVGRIVRDVLFLAHESPTRLPLMYIASPLAVSVIGLGYSKIAARFRRDRLIVPTTLLLLVLLTIARLSLGPRWLYYALYIGTECMGALVMMQFWTTAGDHFSPREAKRAFGLIAAGGTVANIAIGLAISTLVKTTGAENLLFSCIGALAIISLLSVVVDRKSAARNIGGRSSREMKAQLARKSAPSKGSKTVSSTDVAGASHLKLLVPMILCAVLASTLLDFQFKSIATQSFKGDRVAMVRFFSLLSCVTGVISLIIQLGVTGRVIERAGVAGALLLLPSTLGIGAALLLVAPSLAAATVSKAADSTFRYTVHDAGMQLLYLPVPSAVRSRKKAFLDAVIKPTTEAATGAGLFLYRTYSLPRAPLAAAALFVAMGWVYAVLRMRTAYAQSIRDTLRNRKLAPRQIRDRLEHDARADIEHATSPDEATAAVEVATLGKSILAHETAADKKTKIALDAELDRLAVAICADDEKIRDRASRELLRLVAYSQLWAHDYPALSRALHQAIHQELERAYFALAAAAELGREESVILPDGTKELVPYLPDDIAGPAALLSRTLSERSERARSRLFALIGAVDPGIEVGAIEDNLRDRDPVRRANALELLDAVRWRKSIRPVKALAIALCDGSSRDAKLAVARKQLSIPHKSQHEWIAELRADPNRWVAIAATYYAGHIGILQLEDKSVLETAQKVLLLKGVELFSTVSSEDLAKIAEIAEELSFDTHDEIFREGDHGNSLYFIAEGSVAIRAGEKQIVEFGVREVFGEMALLDPAPRSATAIATAPLTVLCIGSDDFRELLAERPEVASGVLRVLTRRLRAANLEVR